MRWVFGRSRPWRSSRRSIRGVWTGRGGRDESGETPTQVVRPGGARNGSPWAFAQRAVMEATRDSAGWRLTYRVSADGGSASRTGSRRRRLDTRPRNAAPCAQDRSWWPGRGLWWCRASSFEELRRLVAFVPGAGRSWAVWPGLGPRRCHRPSFVSLLSRTLSQSTPPRGSQPGAGRRREASARNVGVSPLDQVNGSHHERSEPRDPRGRCCQPRNPLLRALLGPGPT